MAKRVVWARSLPIYLLRRPWLTVGQDGQDGLGPLTYLTSFGVCCAHTVLRRKITRQKGCKSTYNPPTTVSLPHLANPSTTPFSSPALQTYGNDVSRLSRPHPSLNH